MIVEFDGYRPDVAPTAFVAPNAVLIGNVTVRDGASIWFGAVLRADHGDQGIVVGARSSVQDNCVIHVAFDKGTNIGEDCTIGHGAIMEACDVGDGALVGMNCVVLEHATVGERALIAANSTVLAGTMIPPDTLAAGSPAIPKKTIEGGARWWIERSAPYYAELGQRYKRQGLE